MSKIKSAIGKAKTLSNVGLEPFEVGKYNFENPTKESEELAIKRAVICIGCDLMKIEPIESFRIEDTRIPELSNMMCGDCFCELSLKTRQSITICDNWKNML